jgi:rhodanese-related sulfurtransferase
MIKFFTTLTLNQRLALLAFVLGAVALAATPTRGRRTSIDSREMALLMQKGADRVDVRTLAGWIIEGRSDVRLVDLRDPAAFAAGPRIPSAENIPLTALADAGLDRNERILLVSDDEARAAQAWFLMRADGYKGVVVVRGGLRAWQEDVVSPRVDGLAAADRAKAEAISAHFGGTPRIGSGDGAAAPPTPAVAQAGAAPSLPAAGAKKPAAAKKREGC